jgi:hypothetical protein
LQKKAMPARLVLDRLDLGRRRRAARTSIEVSARSSAGSGMPLDELRAPGAAGGQLRSTAPPFPIDESATRARAGARRAPRSGPPCPTGRRLGAMPWCLCIMAS